MAQTNRIRPSSWMIRNQVDGLSRLDLQVVAMAVVAHLDEPQLDTGEATFSDLSDLGFPCEQVLIRQGRKRIGVLAAFVARMNDGDAVVLFAKEGRNLSLKDRNDIRASYDEELKGRFDD